MDYNTTQVQGTGIIKDEFIGYVMGKVNHRGIMGFPTSTRHSPMIIDPQVISQILDETSIPHHN